MARCISNFKSKDDVLKAAIDAQFERFFARVEQEFATLPGARERLEFIGRLHWRRTW